MLKKAHELYNNQNYIEALKLYKQLADEENPDAMTSLGFMYQNGQGVEQNNEKALELCRQAAYGGHQKAKEIIKKLQENGTIVF